MQFPEVMAKTKSRFDNILQRRPLTIEQLGAWIDQETITLREEVINK